MATRKIDLKKLLDDNADLLERMNKEDWNIKFEKKSDQLFIYGKTPKNAIYHYVGNSGFMVRVNPINNKICGFAIENYFSFERKHLDFYLVFLPVAHPIQFKIIKTIMRVVKKMKSINKSQFTEVAEFLSNEASYKKATA